MRTTVVKDDTVGKIERGIPFPVGHKRLLSAEQKQLLRMKDGESFVLVLHFDAFLTDNAQRLVQWARLKGIHAMRRKIDSDSVRIWRVGLLQPVDKQQRELGEPRGT